jgi:hypothetical protein
MLLLETHGSWDLFREGEKHRDHLLGDYWAMHLARIRNHHVAVHQFRKHQLVHGSRLRVNPSQPSRDKELGWPERNPKQYFDISKMLR